MHEVHVPEHSVATWKGFLLHMGTITLGLLLAIALEQIVEAIHHHHQAERLREDLRQEAETNRNRLIHSIRYTLAERDRTDAEIKVARAGGMFPQTPGNIQELIDPSQAVWRAALADQTVGVLSRQEIEMYSEADSMQKAVERALQGLEDVYRPEVRPTLKDDMWDYSKMAQPDRDAYARYLYTFRAHYVREREKEIEYLRAEIAILHGAKDIDEVIAAENTETTPWVADAKPAAK